MSLTDDNFASIVAAVEEGRAIYDNIKKYLSYLLAANIGEIGLVAGASILGFPLPLSAVQILYVNLATDGLPALALAVDPPDSDLMSRPPRAKTTSIWTKQLVALMLIAGGWSALVNLTLFRWALSNRSVGESMALVFVTLVLIEFAKAYSFQSSRFSVLHRPLRNRWLNLAILWELVLLVAVVSCHGSRQPLERTPSRSGIGVLRRLSPQRSFRCLTSQSGGHGVTRSRRARSHRCPIRRERRSPR